MNRHSDDQSIDDELRRFLRHRADDTASVRTADDMVHAIAIRVLDRSAERDRTVRIAWVLLAAGLLGLLAATAILGGGQRLGLLATAPTTTPTTTTTPMPTLTPTPTPASTPTPTTAATAPTAIGPGATLTWSKVDIDERLLKLPDPGTPVDRSTTQIVALGDRFVLDDQDAPSVGLSTDGRTWEHLEIGDPDLEFYRSLLPSLARWGLGGVSWPADSTSPAGGLASPSIVRLLRQPRGLLTESHFGSGEIGAVGIGPAGIVVRVHSALDFDAFVTSFLGPGWVDHLATFDFRDGILRITTDDGRSTRIVWADHGLEPGDVADRGFGWYSSNGHEWRQIPDFPANVSEIVGVSNGFIVRSGSDRWFSSDGMTWRRLVKAGASNVIPWAGAMLETDAVRRFDLWTTAGRSSLPMGAELPADWTDSDKAFGAGALGIVVIGIADHSILFTPDGVDWSIQSMPEAMVQDGGGRRPPTVAVGERSVVVLSWSGDIEAPIPSLWVGTLEP